MSTFYFILPTHTDDKKLKPRPGHHQDSKYDVKPVSAAFLYLEEHHTHTSSLDLWKDLLGRVYKNCWVTVPIVMLSHQMIKNEQEWGNIVHSFSIKTASLFPLSSKFHISVRSSLFIRSHMEGQASFISCALLVTRQSSFTRSGTFEKSCPEKK